MSSTPRVAVVGGGITGAWAAYFLAGRGVETTLIERDQIAAHASGHNPGGLNPLHGPGIPGPMQALALESFRLHLEHWDELRELSDSDFRGGVVSRIHVAMDEAELGALAAAESLYNSTPGFSARLLSVSELAAAEPRVSRRAAGGLWTEGNARVGAHAYTRAVAQAAVELGARIITGEAMGLDAEEGRVTAIDLDVGAVDCDAAVLAPGPWCRQLEEWLQTPVPVVPVKGELLLTELEAGLGADVSRGLIGAYRTGDEGVWLGGTEQRVGYDEGPGDEAQANILAGIRELLPQIGELRVVEHVAGLRPATADGFPIVGIPRPWKNVCIAVGGGRKGMLLSAGIGFAAADLLTSGTTNMSIDCCAPERWSTEQ